MARRRVPDPYMPGLYIDVEDGNGVDVGQQMRDKTAAEAQARNAADADAQAQQNQYAFAAQQAEANRRGQAQLQAQLQTGDERMALFNAGQREQEQAAQREQEQQRLAQQNNQFNQTGRFDMLKEGARIWDQDAARAQQQQQFEAAHNQSAYQFEKAGETQAQQFQAAHDQSAYQYEKTGQTQAQQFYSSQQHQELLQQQQAQLHDWLSQREFGQREAQRLTLLNEGLNSIMSNPNLTDQEKQNAAMEYKTHIDPLESRRKNTEQTMRQQQFAAAKEHQDFQNNLLSEQAQREAQLQAGHARFNASEFKNLGQYDAAGNLWVQHKFGEWTMAKNPAEERAALQDQRVQEQQKHQQDSAWKAYESQSNHVTQNRFQHAEGWAKAEKATRDRIEKNIAEKQKELADVKTDPRKRTDTALINGLEATVADWQKNIDQYHEKDMREHFGRLTGQKPDEKQSARDQLHQWLNQQFPMPKMPQQQADQQQTFGNESPAVPAAPRDDTGGMRYSPTAPPVVGSEEMGAAGQAAVQAAAQAADPRLQPAAQPKPAPIGAAPQSRPTEVSRPPLTQKPRAELAADQKATLDQFDVLERGFEGMPELQAVQRAKAIYDTTHSIANMQPKERAEFLSIMQALKERMAQKPPPDERSGLRRFWDNLNER